MDMKRTASTSPGTAPRTAMGPVRQWPLRLFPASVGTLSPGNACGRRYPDAFNERSTIVSPGSTVSTGGRSRENTCTVVDGDGSSRWQVMQRSSPLLVHYHSRAFPFAPFQAPETDEGLDVAPTRTVATRRGRHVERERMAGRPEDHHP